MLQTNKKNRHRGFAFLTVYCDKMYDKLLNCDHELNGRMLDIKSAVAKEEIPFDESAESNTNNGIKITKKASTKSKKTSQAYKSKFKQSYDQSDWMPMHDFANSQIPHHNSFQMGGGHEMHDSYTGRYMQTREKLQRIQSFNERDLNLSSKYFPNNKTTMSQMNMQPQQQKNMQNQFQPYYVGNNMGPAGAMMGGFYNFSPPKNPNQMYQNPATFPPGMGIGPVPNPPNMGAIPPPGMMYSANEKIYKDHANQNNNGSNVNSEFIQRVI